MKKLLIFVFATMLSFAAFSQPYKQAIGLKYPGGTSITYKNFIANTKALEAQATFWSNGVRFSALYEFNFYTFEGVDGLGWFVGPGIHAGVWNDKYATSKNLTTRTDLGIDGIIGVDYKFKDIPLNFSVDWQPSIVIAGSTGFSPALGGVALRYTF
jgi:hypothetical protein